MIHRLLHPPPNPVLPRLARRAAGLLFMGLASTTAPGQTGTDLLTDPWGCRAARHAPGGCPGPVFGHPRRRHRRRRRRRPRHEHLHRPHPHPPAAGPGRPRRPRRRGTPRRAGPRIHPRRLPQRRPPRPRPAGATGTRPGPGPARAGVGLTDLAARHRPGRRPQQHQPLRRRASLVPPRQRLRPTQPARRRDPAPWARRSTATARSCPTSPCPSLSTGDPWPPPTDKANWASPSATPSRG